MAERPDPIETAKAIIAERFPDAIQAWLGGSVASGTYTHASDIDIKILLTDDNEARRESTTFRGWPVELLINTEKSVRYWLEGDIRNRSPATCMLIVKSIPLIPGDGGKEIREHARKILEAGPAPLDEEQMDAIRYTLTDMIDDLEGGGSAVVMSGMVVDAWLKAADLLLESQRRWRGDNGKYLMRNIQELDRETGTHWAEKFQKALIQGLGGVQTELVALIDEILDKEGGRIRDGYTRKAPAEAQKLATD